MNIAERIKRLRQERNLSQAKLAEKIDADARRISNYENKKQTPSLETAAKIAEVFNVSVDYLIKANVENMADVPIKDRELLGQFKEVDQMNEEERKYIKFFVQSVIDKNHLKKMIQKAI